MKTSLPLLESKFFCVLPWLHMAVFPDGSASLCCVANTPISEGGDPRSLQTDSLPEIWNSDYVRGVRRDMLAGKPVAACSVCYVAEKSGGASYRQQHNARWTDELGPLLDEIIESSRLQNFAAPTPIFYQLMPGNLCNLKCRMCTPDFSSLIERDSVHSAWAPPVLEHLGRSGVDWSTSRVSIAPRQPLGVRHEGFHSLEDPKGQPFRWTTGRASVVVPLPPGVKADRVRLRLRPSPVPGKRLRVLVNGVKAYEGKTSRHDFEQVFHVSTSGTELTVALECDTFRSGTDPRELGVAVESLEVAHSACPIPAPVGAHRLPDGPWYHDDAWVRDVLLANADQLRGLYFTGGEPMLEKQVEHVLDQLIERGAADHVALELNTNCTALREPVFSKMRQFRHLTLGLSIDAHGATYEYIRFPARWETVRKNVERLVALVGDRLTVVATVTLQVYNALDIVRILEYFDEMNIAFNIQIVGRPWFLGVGVLPASVRALAAARLREYAEGRDKPHQREVLALARRIERIKDECTPDALRTLMLFTNDLDVTRRQSVREVHGELVQMLAAEGFHWTDELSLAKKAAA